MENGLFPLFIQQLLIDPYGTKCWGAELEKDNVSVGGLPKSFQRTRK